LVPMTLRRDSASDLAQTDLDGLLNALLPFAQQELEKLGELFPFGVIVTVDGETRLLGVDAMQDERPDRDPGSERGHPFGGWPSDFHEAILHRLRSSSDGGHDLEEDRPMSRRET
jgi:hypothetical protein